MSNLGRYQEIAVLAKSVGGVDQLIEIIESDSVKKSAPILLGAGAVIALGARSVIVAGKRGVAKYKKSGTAAAAAKEQLKAIVGESMDPDADDSTGLGDDTGNPD